MTPQRLVAAIAALAVGFGVTLVGVSVADDETDSIASVETVDTDPSSTEADAGAQQDEAQQDEAPADPPPDAEVVDDDAAPAVPSGGDTPPRDSTDSDDPSSSTECEAVLVVRTGSGELLILSSELGEFTESGTDFFVSGSNDSIREVFQPQAIALISGIIDDRFGSRSVENCETGAVSDATILIEATEADLDEGRPGDIGEEPGERRVSQTFPCSDDAFDALLDELDGLEEVELIAETDVFVRVLAKSLAQFGGASVAQWEADVEEQFDGFTDSDACSDAIDDVFVDGGGDGFFCASANVSADARLFVYLDEVVPDRMTRCSYVQEGVT